RPDGRENAAGHGAAARIRRRAAYRANRARSARAQSGHDLSGAAPARAKRMDREGVGHEREQPPRQVLRDYARGPEAARRRSRELGAHGRDGQPSARRMIQRRAMLTFIRVAASRVRGGFRQRRRDAELVDEIQAHLDLLTDEYVRSGMSRDAACAAARRDFGGVEQMKDTYRDQRGFPFVDSLLQDLRYATR